MSSISFCVAGVTISDRSSSRALARSTGCPMRATFRMDMFCELYLPRMSELHPHDDAPAFRFCPRCGHRLEQRVLKASEPPRLVCAACEFVFYLDPKIAVGTIIRSA